MKFRFLLMLTILCISQVSGDSPVVDVLDLNVDGTTEQIIEPDKSFDYIHRMIWYLEFTENSLDHTEFGDGVALTNGVDVRVNNESILDNSYIKDLGDFAKHSYDLDIKSDDGNPKNRVLISRWSFDKFTQDGIGLYAGSNNNFTIHIRDDITAYLNIIAFEATLEGCLGCYSSGASLADLSIFSNGQTIINYVDPVFLIGSILVICIVLVVKKVKRVNEKKHFHDY